MATHQLCPVRNRCTSSPSASLPLLSPLFKRLILILFYAFLYSFRLPMNARRGARNNAYFIFFLSFSFFFSRTLLRGEEVSLWWYVAVLNYVLAATNQIRSRGSCNIVYVLYQRRYSCECRQKEYFVAE